MNIIVSDHSGHYYFRPDNTLIKESKDYYLPSIIEYLELTPAIVIRIDRAAKGLSRQFAHRYISQYSYGILIYPQVKEQYFNPDQIVIYEKAYRIEKFLPFFFQETLKTTLDSTTYISDNFFPMDEIKQEEEVVSLTIGKHIYRYKIPPSNLLKDKIFELMENITTLSSLKTGDLLFLELEPETENQIPKARQYSDILLSSSDKGKIMTITIR